MNIQAKSDLAKINIIL